MLTADTPTVVLLTDFGVEDAYVGVMKSVIVSRCPGCAFVDLSHAVGPQNVRQASYLLWTAYKYLPEGAVTLCVVDPGVGTERRPLAVEWTQGFFVGPDNGWLSLILRDTRGRDDGAGMVQLPHGWQAVELTDSRFWLNPVSRTFHGRDIFAPAAAALARGTSIEELGQPTRELAGLDIGSPRIEDGRAHGRVIHVDHFGNLITDIGTAYLSDRFTVSLGGGTIEGPAASYQSNEPLVALVGSAGLLEIAAPNGSASRLINVGLGEPVTVTSRRPDSSR